jgi:prepilin-type N-terminal cleavage/methylation domain-containing protein
VLTASTFLEKLFMQYLSKNKKAFTLIEMVVVIAILGLVGGALSSIIQYFYRSNDFVLQEQTAVGSARQGLWVAMNNLREASYGDDGAYPIGTAATSSLVFYADVNGSSDVQQIRYYLQNGTLYRGVTYATGTPLSYAGQTQSTTTIATYVVNATSSPIFHYYDSTGNLLSSPVTIVNIAAIQTTLQIDVDVHRTPGTYSLVGSATLRNLRGAAY